MPMVQFSWHLRVLDLSLELRFGFSYVRRVAIFRVHPRYCPSIAYMNLSSLFIEILSLGRDE